MSIIDEKELFDRSTQFLKLHTVGVLITFARTFRPKHNLCTNSITKERLFSSFVSVARCSPVLAEKAEVISVAKLLALGQISCSWFRV